MLEYLAGSVAGCRVVRASGVESELELAFAGLYGLCVPMLGGLRRLPGPQREALSTAFGLSDGPPPDRFLVGLALSRLADVAEERPLIFCFSVGLETRREFDIGELRERRRFAAAAVDRGSPIRSTSHS